MFDFLLTHNHTENPTALAILITVLSSFFLASLITLTYETTTRGLQKPYAFLQSMVLIAIVAATVMQAIGDSLARGLGMLGALAIIRFRTKLDSPRNMAFMFAALATGIACGVYGFTIAFIGTIGFCLAAIILRFSPLATQPPLIGTLKIEVLMNSGVVPQVEQLLKQYCAYSKLEQLRFSNLQKTKKIKDEAGNIIGEQALDNRKELTYQIRLKTSADWDQLAQALEQLPDLQDLRLRFNEESVSL